MVSVQFLPVLFSWGNSPMLPVGLSPPEAVGLIASGSGFLGQMRAGDEARDVGPGKAVLVAATGGFPSGV